MENATSGDPISIYLEYGGEHLCQALTDESMIPIHEEECRANRRRLTEYDKREWARSHTNADLATLGDSVLRLALTQLLADRGYGKVSDARQEYESDKSLVTVIARHYDLWERIDTAGKDGIRGKSYRYTKKKNNNPQKYIATAMEAVLGAFYLDVGKNMVLVEKAVGFWMMLVDSEIRRRESPLGQELVDTPVSREDLDSLYEEGALTEGEYLQNLRKIGY